MRKQYILLATVIAAVFSVAIPASAQDSGCGNGKVTAEQYECANQQLATAQQDLASALNEVLQHYTPKSDDSKEDDLPSPEKSQQAEYHKKMRQRLDVSQRAWLQYQEAACAAVLDFYEGGTAGPAAAALCKAEMAKQRAQFLRENF